MNVLSLFDGMSCGQIALNRTGIKYDKYFASEIDKNAIKVTQKNYPKTIQLGDICDIRSKDLPGIDLVMGGSPCQGFSFAGKQLAFKDPRSKLFFEFARLLKDIKPKYFLLENVRMKKEHESVINRIIGEIYPECISQLGLFDKGEFEPIMIDSSLVSAQNRVRLYWTNILNVTQPKDKKIFLKDIIEHGFVDRDKSFCIDANYMKSGNIDRYFRKGSRQLVFEKPHGQNKGGISEKEKFATIRSCTKGNYAVMDGLEWRKLTPIECERLQTVPENYTDCVSNSQRYKLLGNGWTVDVIAHILKGIK